MQNLWLLICFFSALHFFGPGYNPLFLIPGLLGPLLVLFSTPAATFTQVARGAPLFFWGCVACIALIMTHYLVFSYSVDSSYIPSVGLACLPLWALIVSLLGARRQFWLWLSLLIAGFACFSVVDFLWLQQRAHAPLRDPGNYVTLLNLVWLPWLFRAIKPDQMTVKLAWLSAFTWVFVLAQLATHSRFAVLVSISVCLLLVVATLRYRIAWRQTVTICAAVALAFMVYLSLDPAGAQSAFEAAAGSETQSHRLLLWQSAWMAVQDLGGLNGTGLYTFSIIYPMFRSILEQNTAGLLVHNDFLQIILEGGIWLFVPLLCLSGGVVYGLGRSLIVDRFPTARTFLLLALAVALLHSMVNFVLYIVPLCMLFGVIVALAFAPSVDVVQQRASPDLRAGIVKFTGIGLLVANVFYLSLDVMTLGVFTGHHHVPGSGYFRSDSKRMLGYARLAQSLNPDRAIPIFAEARILEIELEQSVTPLRLFQAESAYKKAVAVDPWNPYVLISYANFVERHGREVKSTDAPAELLAKAMTLNAYDVQTNAALLDWRTRHGDHAGALAIAENIARWCTTMSRSPAALGMFEQAQDLALSAQAVELVTQIEQCTSALSAGAGGGRKQTWFMRWLAAQNS